LISLTFPPHFISDPCHHLQQPDTIPTRLTGYTDSDWGCDHSHRRSISGVIILLAAATVLYKTKFQKAVALSSIETEFVSGSDGGKMLLYLRSLLKDLGFEQPNPTHMNQDNRGTIHMANAQAPTRRCRHIDIHYFALLQWVEDGHFIFVPVPTNLKVSDSLTTASTGRIKFHQHANIYMGRTPPPYAANGHTICITRVLSLSATQDHTIIAMFDYD
jgi:hypothetical protein